MQRVDEIETAAGQRGHATANPVAVNLRCSRRRAADRLGCCGNNQRCDASKNQRPPRIVKS